MLVAACSCLVIQTIINFAVMTVDNPISPTSNNIRKFAKSINFRGHLLPVMEKLERGPLDLSLELNRPVSPQLMPALSTNPMEYINQLPRIKGSGRSYYSDRRDFDQEHKGLLADKLRNTSLMESVDPDRFQIQKGLLVDEFALTSGDKIAPSLLRAISTAAASTHSQENMPPPPSNNSRNNLPARKSAVVYREDDDSSGAEDVEIQNHAQQDRVFTRAQRLLARNQARENIPAAAGEGIKRSSHVVVSADSTTLTVSSRLSDPAKRTQAQGYSPNGPSDDHISALSTSFDGVEHESEIEMVAYTQPNKRLRSSSQTGIFTLLKKYGNVVENAPSRSTSPAEIDKKRLLQIDRQQRILNRELNLAASNAQKQTLTMGFKDQKQFLLEHEERLKQEALMAQRELEQERIRMQSGVERKQVLKSQDYHLKDRYRVGKAEKIERQRKLDEMDGEHRNEKLLRELNKLEDFGNRRALEKGQKMEQFSQLQNRPSLDGGFQHNQSFDHSTQNVWPNMQYPPYNYNPYPMAGQIQYPYYQYSNENYIPAYFTSSTGQPSQDSQPFYEEDEEKLKSTLDNKIFRRFCDTYRKESAAAEPLVSRKTIYRRLCARWTNMSDSERAAFAQTVLD